RVWHEVNELRKAKPCPMHSRHFWTCMAPALFLFGDLKVAIRNYEALYEEVRGFVRDGRGAIANEKYRLGFGQLPPWHSLDFFDVLAERGWNFVFESPGYHPPIPIDLSNIGDPLERIARNTLHWYTGYYKYANEAHSEAGYPYTYIQWAKEYEIDGMFLHPLVSCRAASNYLPYVRETLANELDIPSLWIQGDIVDVTVFDPADALRKAEAFEEIMDHYREKRRATRVDG
ncbi:MAG: 2-hydroxyacyl-CoA dehydratase, partial [Deltaproteobacteria bacterium]|nr:2-hydroxyacyl-CoA dehydratase [Deltaproteobacteria bacterium]